MNKGITNCKYQEAQCAFNQKFGDGEPEVVDCLLCVNAGISSAADCFMEIVAAVGARQFTREFLIQVIELNSAYGIRHAIMKEVRPERIKAFEEYKNSQGFTPFTFDDIPPELKKAFENYKKRGDRMRI